MTDPIQYSSPPTSPTPPHGCFTCLACRLVGKFDSEFTAVRRKIFFSEETPESHIESAENDRGVFSSGTLDRRLKEVTTEGSCDPDAPCSIQQVLRSSPEESSEETEEFRQASPENLKIRQDSLQDDVFSPAPLQLQSPSIVIQFVDDTTLERESRLERTGSVEDQILDDLDMMLSAEDDASHTTETTYVDADSGEHVETREIDLESGIADDDVAEGTEEREVNEQIEQLVTFFNGPRSPLPCDCGKVDLGEIAEQELFQLQEDEEEEEIEEEEDMAAPNMNGNTEELLAYIEHQLNSVQSASPTYENQAAIDRLCTHDLESPDPESPDPESPDPESPDPESPDPESPDPESPESESTDTESPDVLVVTSSSEYISIPETASPETVILASYDEFHTPQSEPDHPDEILNDEATSSLAEKIVAEVLANAQAEEVGFQTPDQPTSPIVSPRTADQVSEPELGIFSLPSPPQDCPLGNILGQSDVNERCREWVNSASNCSEENETESLEESDECFESDETEPTEGNVTEKVVEINELEDTITKEVEETDSLPEPVEEEDEMEIEELYRRAKLLGIQCNIPPSNHAVNSPDEPEATNESVSQEEDTVDSEEELKKRLEIIEGLRESDVDSDSEAGDVEPTENLKIMDGLKESDVDGEEESEATLTDLHVPVDNSGSKDEPESPGAEDPTRRPGPGQNLNDQDTGAQKGDKSRDHISGGNGGAQDATEEINTEEEVADEMKPEKDLELPTTTKPVITLPLDTSALSEHYLVSALSTPLEDLSLPDYAVLSGLSSRERSASGGRYRSWSHGECDSGYEPSSSDNTPSTPLEKHYPELQNSEYMEVLLDTNVLVDT